MGGASASGASQLRREAPTTGSAPTREERLAEGEAAEAGPERGAPLVRELGGCMLAFQHAGLWPARNRGAGRRAASASGAAGRVELGAAQDRVEGLHDHVAEEVEVLVLGSEEGTPQLHTYIHNIALHNILSHNIR